MNNETGAPPDPVVQLTREAADRIKTMIATDPEHAGKGLRVHVESGGCSGLQYRMVFDQSREGDFKAEFFGVSVLVDPVSADYLRGTTIDFNDGLSDAGFKIHNPRARQSCGCGRSFGA